MLEKNDILVVLFGPALYNVPFGETPKKDRPQDKSIKNFLLSRFDKILIADKTLFDLLKKFKVEVVDGAKVFFEVWSEKTKLNSLNDYRVIIIEDEVGFQTDKRQMTAVIETAKKFCSRVFVVFNNAIDKAEDINKVLSL